LSDSNTTVVAQVLNRTLGRHMSVTRSMSDKVSAKKGFQWNETHNDCEL